MNVGNSLVALKIQNNMSSINTDLTKQNQKLSSGMRINGASDDAAGLKISEKMRSQIRGLDMALDNATDGISLLQTADGGLSKISDLLHRMNELSIKAGNGVNTNEDLDKISIEYEQCKDEINRIAETTTFNGKKLLNVNMGETYVEEGMRKAGTNKARAMSTDLIDFSTIGDGNRYIVTKGDQKYTFEFSYGGNNSSIGDSIKINLTGKETNEEKAQKLAETIEDNVPDVITDYINSLDKDDGKHYTISVKSGTKIVGEVIELEMETYAPIIKIGNNSEDELFLSLRSVTAKDLGIEDTGLLTTAKAEDATKKVLDAINFVSSVRGKIGALQNQLENSIKRITIEKENTEASESRIRNVDMAKEMVTNAKTKIIQQSSVSMLAQANQTSGSVLKLIR